MGDLPTVVLRIRILKILSKSVTLVGILFLLTSCAQRTSSLLIRGVIVPVPNHLVLTCAHFWVPSFLLPMAL